MNSELDVLLQVLKVGGTPALGAGVYFLWRIERSINAMKVSNDVLQDTLLRLVPGFGDALRAARRERKERQTNESGGA